MERINCFKCKHYRTTWNTFFPRACKAYEFKGKEIPSLYVLKVSGEPCKHFQAKDIFETPQKKNTTSIIDRTI